MPIKKGYRFPEKWRSAPCAVCGKPMTFRHYRPKTFCSRSCVGKGRPRRAADPAKRRTSVCLLCGVVFGHPACEERRYCSLVCSGRANIATSLGRYFTPSRAAAVCEVCGGAFDYTPGGHRGRFCSRACFGRWLAAEPARTAQLKKFGKGHKTRRRGSPPVTKTCPVCGAGFTVKASHDTKRLCCSRRCYGVVQSQRQSGPNSPVWRGGYEPYYGPSWRAARAAARRRDRVCRRCGMTARRNGRALDVHHLTPFRSFGAERHADANALGNLITLCPRCHTLEEWATTRRV